METRPNFEPGTSVIYGIHGKCSVLSVEQRVTNGSTVHYYKLEPVKSSFSRSQRQEPSIWVPVLNAQERGLRAPMTQADAEACLELFKNREYFFPIDQHWTALQPQLENTIRSEGAIGLAKALSFLYVLRKKQVAPHSDANRMFETVSKLLVREMAEAMNQQPRAIEDQIAKAIRTKLIGNH
jgi:RNA polymerase-interacting CarD/CdnL/TRCF family regulator